MKTNFKHFTINQDSTIDSIKKQYKKLAFQFHPDINPDNLEQMKELNNEYELALKELGTMNNKNYSLDEEFISIIDELIKLRMKDVTIEICGWFVYVSGTTKPYKDALGKNGLKLIWNPKKIAWYYKPSWYTKKGGKTWSMDKIRNTYGSEYANTSQERQEELAM